MAHTFGLGFAYGSDFLCVCWRQSSCWGCTCAQGRGQCGGDAHPPPLQSLCEQRTSPPRKVPVSLRSLAWNAGGAGQCQGTGIDRVKGAGRRDCPRKAAGQQPAAGHAQDAEQLLQFRGGEAGPCTGTDTGASDRLATSAGGAPSRQPQPRSQQSPSACSQLAVDSAVGLPGRGREAQHHSQTRKLKFRAAGSRRQSKSGRSLVCYRSFQPCVCFPASLSLLLPFFLSDYNS